MQFSISTERGNKRRCELATQNMHVMGNIIIQFPRICYGAAATAAQLIVPTQNSNYALERCKRDGYIWSHK